MIVLVSNRPNFVYLLVDPGFVSLPLNFYEALHFIHAYDRCPWQRQRTNELTSLCPFVCLLVCVLDWVWHKLLMHIYLSPNSITCYQPKGTYTLHSER